MTFHELGLRPELLRALDDAGYKTPTPIQAKAIPVALSARDLAGCAQTGSGKTAAFLLPILMRLETRQAGAPRALVVAPTRELAAQIAASAEAYARHLGLRAAVVHGGVSLRPEVERLRRGIDLLVATPGRLLDHMERRSVSLASVRIVVLDEADRMLDMGFLPAVERVLEALPRARQTLLFSATMPAPIKRLARRYLVDPAWIEVSPPATTVDTVRQVVHPVDALRKRDLLCRILSSGALGPVLVFTRTKARADRLARYLAASGRRVAAIHGDKTQGARTRALERFRGGLIDTLVATDLAARGLDVQGISHVVNFDVPTVAEDYVHRIGRTARAGASGHAISLVSADELDQVQAIERLIGMRIAREAVEGFEASAEPKPRPLAARASSSGRPGTHRRSRGRGAADRRAAPLSGRGAGAPARSCGRRARKQRPAHPSRSCPGR